MLFSISPTGTVNQNEEIIDNSGTVFYFYVKDKAGVVKKDVTITSEKFNSMNISSLNPTITGTDGWTNNGTIGVTFTRIPNVTYQYTTDGGTGWSSLSGSSFSVTSEGDYTNKIKVKASYKNESRETSTPVNYKYDKTPPTTSVSGSGTTLTGSYSDSLSGVKSYLFTTNSSSNSTETFTNLSSAETSGNKSTSFSNSTRYFFVKDAAGNISARKSATHQICGATGWTGNVKHGTINSASNTVHCCVCGTLISAKDGYHCATQRNRCLNGHESQYNSMGDFYWCKGHGTSVTAIYMINGTKSSSYKCAYAVWNYG